MIKVNMAQSMMVYSMTHVSEHEVFRRGDASQKNWLITLESWVPGLGPY